MILEHRFVPRLQWLALLVPVAFLALLPDARAQQSSLRIGYVYPAGGRQGSSFQAVVGGRFLDGVTNVYVSGSGVQATVIEFNKPLTQRQFTLLREELKELQAKRAAGWQDNRKRRIQIESPSATNAAPRAAWTAEDEKRIAEVRKQLANPPNRLGNPAIAETVLLAVTMASDATPGQRELRLGTPIGLSNPLVFHVGQWPEFSQKAAKSMKTTPAGPAMRTGPENPEMNVTLPAVLNGQIMPGAVDRFRFKATQGQRLVFATSARELIPYLPDAVPGWFQAAVALYDANGKELMYADHFSFHPDPVLYFEIPKEGAYVLEIRDSIYRGREDFVYRITVGELPYVTSIFPLGGPAGAPTTVAIAGWNLTTTNLTMDAREKAPGICLLSGRQAEPVFNRVLFSLDTLPECLEKEPNNEPGSAQPVTLPLIVNGRIGRPGDWDVFRFEGRAGDPIVAEVYARRLNSPLDSLLKLTDATGRQLAFNDDYEDKGEGLTTHHADSRLSASLPATGTYYLHLGDAQQKGGPEYGYRLRISPPRPDFKLRVVPSSINARAGTAVPLTVYALREDGFSNEIALVLKDAPKGFALNGGRVPANQDRIRLTLAVPPMQTKEPLNLLLEGRATVEGRRVARLGVPAEDMMQAFSYRHLVPVQDLKVAVTGRWMPRASLKVLSELPLKLPAGGTARILIALPGRSITDKIELELSEPPEGVTIRNVSPVPDGIEVILQSDAAKAKPGLSGNLIVNVLAGNAMQAGKGKAQVNRRPLTTLPAVPFEIIALLR